MPRPARQPASRTRLTCTIPIHFTPDALGARLATLTLTDNAGTGTQHVALSGTGTADLTVSPTSFSTGDVKFGASLSRPSLS